VCRGHEREGKTTQRHTCATRTKWLSSTSEIDEVQLGLRVSLMGSVLPPQLSGSSTRNETYAGPGMERIELSELYDSNLIRQRYRFLAGSQKPALIVFKLLETKGPLPVRQIIQLSGYKKTRIYETLKLLRSQGIIRVHKGLCYLSV
jgi:hypothetical protein